MESKRDIGELPTASEQELWDLLGRNRPVEVSPFFSRRVLRDLDASASASWNEATTGWRSWLRPAWMLTGSTAVLAVVVGIFSFVSLTGRLSLVAVHRYAEPSVVLVAPVPVAAPTAVEMPVPQVSAAPIVAAVAMNSGVVVRDVSDDVSPQDVDVIADLDNLVAREETSVWTDDTSRF